MDTTGAPPEEEERDEVESGPSISTPVLLIGAVAVGILGASCLAGAYVLALPILNAPAADEYAVATRTMDAGEKIKEGDVAFVSGVVVPGAVADPEKLIGRVAADVIYSGDPLIDARLAPEGRPAGTIGLTPTGMRSIWFSADAGIAGLGLSGGDRVDVYAVGRMVEDTEVVASAVDVLAIEHRAVSGDKITLAVTPEQSDAIGRAREKGTPLAVTLWASADVSREPPPPTPIEVGDVAEGEVVHALRPLLVGEPITADALVLLPRSGHGKRQFTRIDEVVGRVPTRTVFAGERPIEAVLSATAEGRGLAQALAPGERAVSLSLAGNPVDDFHPGVKVDVFGLTDKEGVAELIGEEPMEVIGVQKQGEGCPCIAIRAPLDLATEVVVHRTNNTLGLRYPAEE